MGLLEIRRKERREEVRMGGNDGARETARDVRVELERELAVLALVHDERELGRDHRVDEAQQAGALVVLDDLAVDLGGGQGG